MHSVKQKTNSDFHFQVPYEAKSEFRFRLPGMFEAKNEFRFPFPCTLWSKIGIPILLSECPGSEKWIPIWVSGHSVKRKMNSDFAFRVSGKPKMNSDFAFWVLRKPKMNCDFASLSVRSRQNELRFCFPECLWSEIEIHFWLHFIRWIGDNNLLNLRLRVLLYTPHFVSLIDEWRWMTRGFMRWLPSSRPNGRGKLFGPS